MLIEKIAVGKSAPEDVNVIIEIPANGAPIKYEMEKDNGALWVDRFMNAAMFYPANYGFIPHTLADDGDPVDVLVVTPTPLMPGSVIRCRPVGMLKMTDESGEDAKVIAVPVAKLTPLYDNITTYEDLPKLLLDQIQHFFEQYKALDKGKWVKVDGFVGIDEAHKEITDGMARAAKG